MAAKKTTPKTNPSGPVPEPRERRRTSIVYIVFSLFVTLLGIAVLIAGVLLVGQKRFETAGPLAEAKTVSIRSGSSSAQIADLLYREGVIADRQLFYFASGIYHRLGRTLKAGEYRFEARSSMQQVFDRISAGKSLAHNITIPEGLTTMQALERIRESDVLIGDLPETLPEGSLLPDTYRVQRGDTRADVIKRMTAAQAKLLKDLWAQRKPGLPLKSMEEAVILASIVEKETGVASERAHVAGVFINRLRRNMRLQSDPTIIYGIVGGVGKLGRPIRRSEIDAKTPYNTYQIDGLPPTPIANPGRDSIQAVLNPLDTEDIYFVADGNGGHVFAKTLAQHQANVKAYREIERQQREAEQAAEEEKAQPEEAPEADTGETAPAPQGNTPGPAEEGAAQDAAAATGQELPVVGLAAGADGPPASERATYTASGIPLPRSKPESN